MPKTKEELNNLKKEINELNKKLSELDEEELRQVAGAKEITIKPSDDEFWHSFNPNFTDDHKAL